MIDIAVIGAGPTGLFTAFQAGTLGLNTLIIDSLPTAGGQCKVLYPEKYIYDIPAYPKLKAGELIDKLLEQISPFTPQFLLNTTIQGVKVFPDRVELFTKDKNLIEVKALIIASGGGKFEPNRPPLNSIEQFEDQSVFYSIPDVNLFKGKIVAIAGGGDSAADWAITLSDIAEKIYFIHRRNNLRCAPASSAKILQLVGKNIINLVIPYQLDKLYGKDGKLTQIELAHIADNSIRKQINVEFLLPFFGLKMDLSAMQEWGLKINKGHIEVENGTFKTNLSRVYAIGDAVTYLGKIKLILTGFSEAAAACHNIAKELFPDKVLNFQYSTNQSYLFEPST